MTVKFNKLVSEYPTKQRREFFADLGGEWPDLVDNDNYRNTCTVRLSVAVKGAGGSIPPRFKEAQDGAGSPLVLKVVTMKDLVVDLFGKPSWGMSKQPGIPVKRDDLPRSSGIIAYHVNWKDATGHFDLWTGSNFVGAGNLDDISDGYMIEMWFVS